MKRINAAIEMKIAKKPLCDNPNVQAVHELANKGLCKERSDGIAIVTLCVNRVQSYSLNGGVQ
ncbi:MAG: hypothetical protein ACI4MZ_04050 [Christensenellales bacterium]